MSKTSSKKSRIIKRAVFTLIAAALFFFICEGVCRIIEYRAPLTPSIESPMSMQYVPKEVLHINKESNLLRFFMKVSDQKDSFAWPKPKDTFRVYVFGGSAAMGMGFIYNGAFSRWLERMLQEACPGVNVETANLASVGYSSNQVLRLVTEVLEKGEPDLLVIYSGNNEFLDIKAGIAMERVARLPARKIHGALAERFALVRLLKKAFPKTSWNQKAEIELDENTKQILSNCLNIELDNKTVNKALARYESNLRRIAQKANEKNVPVVLCTLLANPFADLFSFSLDKSGIVDVSHFEDLNEIHGWLRLGRPDLAEPKVKKLSYWGPKIGLLRIFEAGGVRGINRLSPSARKSLAETVEELIEDLEKIDGKGNLDKYALSLCYRISGKEDRLAELIGPIVESSPPSADFAQAATRALFAQFQDEAKWRKAFYELWEHDPPSNKATPRTNAVVRKVAKSEGLVLADVERDMPDWLDPSPLRYLTDYCHFNIEGAFETAYLVYRKALASKVLPAKTKFIDFRSEMLGPDLRYLREKGHDFVHREKWMGFDFRICYAYCRPPAGGMDIFETWSRKEGADFTDKEIVRAFTQNRKWHTRFKD